MLLRLDLPRAGDGAFSVETDLRVFKIVEVPDRLRFVMEAPVQGIEENQGRYAAALRRALRHRPEPDPCHTEGDQNPFGNLVPQLRADQLVFPRQLPDLLPFLHLVFFVHVDQVLHGPGDFRVELRSRPLHDLLADKLLGHGAPVAPVGRHRVVGVRDGNNPRDFRDIFACLASGARLSFILSLSVSIINFFIGVIWGSVSGYYGGATDLIMERITDILISIPFIVVATLFQMHLADKVGSFVSLLFAFITTGWIGIASRVRTQFYRFKGQEYILAARTLGASDGRLIFRHILPNSLGTIITGTVLIIPGVIFSEANLSFLGIVNLETSGITSVGTLLSGGQSYLSKFPHMIFFPALFISLLEISFNLFGNGLRDAFNPSLRGADE